LNLGNRKEKLQAVNDSNSQHVTLTYCCCIWWLWWDV